MVALKISLAGYAYLVPGRSADLRRSSQQMPRTFRRHCFNASL